MFKFMIWMTVLTTGVHCTYDLRLQIKQRGSFFWNENKNHWFPSRRIWALGSRFVMWSFKAFQARSPLATKRMGYIASRSKNLY